MLFAFSVRPNLKAWRNIVRTFRGYSGELASIQWLFGLCPLSGKLSALCYDDLGEAHIWQRFFGDFLTIDTIYLPVRDS
jgi:hypothetical protein